MTIRPVVVRGSIGVAATVLALGLLGALTLARPAGARTARAQTARQTASRTAAITKKYVETFYPLWFTHFQWALTPHNQLIGPNRISPIYHSVVAINDDTLYASTVVDLTNGPVVLTVPKTPVGYSVLNLDPYGNIFNSGVPSHAAGSGTPTKVYVLIPPGYTKPLPAGLIRIHMPYDVSAVIFRADKYSPSGQNDVQAASKFRASLRLQPLRDFISDPTGGTANIVPEYYFAAPFKTTADTLLRVAPLAFLAQMQGAVHALNMPALTPAEKALSDAFDAAFGPGGAGLSRAQKLVFSTAARAAHRAILSNYLDNRGPTNWIHFTNIGDWGHKVLDRASITEFIQFGNGISTAAYYHTFRDKHGVPLTGSRTRGYVLTFPKGGQPPAERFWSLTAYTPNSVELIPNRARKYLVASYTPRLRSRNGSVSIYISHTRPRGVPRANWLPVGKGRFNLMLRVYGVKAGSSVADNTYVPPPIKRR